MSNILNIRHINKKYFLIIISLLSGTLMAQVPGETIQKAKDFLILLENQKFEEATDYFAPIVYNQLPANRLKDIWIQINNQVGSFEKLVRSRTETMKNWNVVYQTCKFEKSLLDLKLVFTEEDKITGIFFVPSKPEIEYKLAPYAVKDSYTESPLNVISGSYELPGTLTIPINKKSFPLIIFIHGSGQNDRDESIGPNKPFKDFATGFASMGIATFRYDKRNFIYREQDDYITPEQETIEDSRAAIALAGQIPGVSKIFILGHSLGAYLLPRIATGQKDLKGMIMMAGNARPLEDLIIEQVIYLVSQNGLTQEEEQKINEIKTQVELVKSESLTEDTMREQLPLNIPASYWLYLKKYEPVKTLKKLKIPVLIMQGERDYQVTMTDFGIWKKELSRKKNVNFRSYEKLNHLFMEGEGKSKPEEYIIPSHIPHYVIQDITDWINEQE